MSDQLELTKTEPLAALRRRRSARRIAASVIAGFVAVAAVAAVSVVAAGLTVTRVVDHTTVPAAVQHRQVTPTAAPDNGKARSTAIEALLRRRSVAVVDHDRTAFLATIDPASTRFRREQATMFANFARVHFASWAYTLGSGVARLPAGTQKRYDAPTYTPAGFALHYRIAGFDAHPTDLRQYPTFVRRSGRWYLASLTDFRRRGDISATDLWDYAPVHVVRRASVLVLGPQSQLATMAEVADQAEAAIPDVTAVWGRNWARRAVVLVPSTQHEMGLINSDRADLDQIAALTSSEVGSVQGRPAPVGDRITINPRNWPKLGSVGAAVVLTHELTHVASRADTSSQTPKWLSEGFADYVGFRDAGVAVTIVAAELAADVRAGRAPTQLPTNRAFRGSNPALPQAYEAGWLACRYIAEHYGQRALVRFYRVVGTSHASASVAVATALHSVLGLTRAKFTLVWRGYVQAELAP